MFFASLGSTILEQTLGREKAYFTGSGCLFTLKLKGLAVSCCKQRQIIWTDIFLFITRINEHVHTHAHTDRHTGTCIWMHELFGNKSEKENEGGMRLEKVNERKITPLGLTLLLSKGNKGVLFVLFCLVFPPNENKWLRPDPVLSKIIVKPRVGSWAKRGACCCLPGERSLKF